MKKTQKTKPQKTQQEESLENEIYFYGKKCQLYAEQLENLELETLELRREQAFFENELDKSRELLFSLRIRQATGDIGGKASETRQAKPLRQASMSVRQASIVRLTDNTQEAEEKNERKKEKNERRKK